ncbi:MAG: hypothetical protein FWB93_00245 [Oscillospiraceae bacterium]|nr:hypothetical protein [Oscillospiraceae bacterium]
MVGILYWASFALVAYVFSVRYKLRKEKINALGFVILVMFAIIGLVPLLFAIVTDITFFDDNLELYVFVLSLVMCAFGVTDIAFGTFSKPAKAKEGEKQE